MQAELVRTTTRDGIRLDGLLHSASSTATDLLGTAILIHGTGDNFYGSTALESLVGSLCDSGFHVLRSNTRAHDGINTAQGRQGRFRNGAAYERVDDCRSDLAAWIEFSLARCDKPILLCGHSMGAIKVLYSQAKEQHPMVRSIVAISPPQLSYSMIQKSKHRKQFDEIMLTAKETADQGFGNQLMDVRFPFPMVISAAAYIDKYGEAEQFNILRFIDDVEQPVLFVYGAIELGSAMFAGLPDLVTQIRPEHLATTVQIVDGGNHNYHKRETELSSLVIHWVRGSF